MKILAESVGINGVAFNDYSVIVQQANAKTPSKIKIKGPFIACDVKNVNGRNYSFKYFNETVVPEYERLWISQHRAYNELTHPQSHVVDVRNASDLTVSLVADGTNFIGQAVILNSDSRFGTPGTPNGDILAALLMHGGKMGKSTRGAVDDPSNPIIDENNTYSLICADTVLDPSGPGCYINDIVCQQKDFMVNQHGLIVECAYNNLQKKLNDYKATFDQELKKSKMLNIFQEFLKDINR